MIQDCSFSCCDYSGYCPSSPTYCFYYYTLSEGAIAGITIGSAIVVSIILCIACNCYRKRQVEELQAQIQMDNINRNPPPSANNLIAHEYLQAQPAYGQPNGQQQPNYPQLYYLQGRQQPYG